MGRKGKGGKGGKGKEETPPASDQKQDIGVQQSQQPQQSQDRPQQTQRQDQAQGFQERPAEQTQTQHQPQGFRERPQQQSWPQRQAQDAQAKPQLQKWPKEQRAQTQERNQQHQLPQRPTQSAEGSQKQRWPQPQTQRPQEKPQQQKWPRNQTQGAQEKPQQQKWPRNQAQGAQERPQQQSWPHYQTQGMPQQKKWPKEQGASAQQHHQQKWPQQGKHWDNQHRNVQAGDSASASEGFRTRGQQFPGSAAGVGGIGVTQVEQKERQSQPSGSAPDQGELVPSVSQMELSSTSDLEIGERMVIPTRVKTGTRGRRITIEVNHLLLTLKNTTCAIHYDCTFDPDKISKKVARFVMNRVWMKHFSSRYPAFDGKKNLYSSGEKPLFSGDELSDVIELPKEGQQPKSTGGQRDAFRVKITIKQVDIVDMSQINRFMKEGGMTPQHAIQVLDIVLRNPSVMKCTSVGRSFFSPPEPRNRHYLGSGYELWYGFYQSAILGWQPFLNVDVAHKGFPEGKKVIEVMLDIKGDKVRRGCLKPQLEDLKTKGLGRYEQEDFEKMIKNLRIEYEMPGRGATWRRKYTVIGVVQPSNRQKFKLENGQMITVEEYFRKEKQFVLKYGNLPCLHVGDPKKTNYLPPELCTVVEGQVVMKKLDKFQTAAMIKAAATVPSVRKEKILKSAAHVGFNNDPCINEFGVSVAENFQEVPARILDTPTLKYGRNMMVKVQNGEWRAEAFVSAQSLDRWVVLSASENVRDRETRTFVDLMMQEGKRLGMAIKNPMRVDVLCEQPDWPQYLTLTSLSPFLKDYFTEYKKAQVQLAIVFIPDRPDKVYERLKKIAELDVGLLTSCVREKTRVGDKSTIKNILLKINTKLNGVNHTVIGNECRESVRQLLEGTMLMGADVTHPSSDQTKIPSVAAVTASCGKLAFQYNMDWRLQPPKKEIIGDMQAITRNKIKLYLQANGAPPSRIIFYRDGVSEGQFYQVLHHELTAIRRGCLEALNRLIPVTFLVVQKRHHTRFFPTSPDHADRKGNVLPGTVVDTVITHPTETDFFMVSHASLQGTSRPTKYHKLWDDNMIDEDDLQELTYYLCHMFSRCTRSVSYPAPTYYAHLAAARGRTYLEGDNINLEKLSEEMAKRMLHAAIVNGCPMFFT